MKEHGIFRDLRLPILLITCHSLSSSTGDNCHSLFTSTEGQTSSVAMLRLESLVHDDANS